MTEDIYKEVYFDEYCPTCKHCNTKETSDPCNECLDYPCNRNSHKPIKWEEKK